MVFTLRDFLNLFRLQKVSYEEFCDRLSILDISDTSGQFKIRSGLDEFIARVSKKDDRIARLNTYKQRLYSILVTDAEAALTRWYEKYVSINLPLHHYFTVPVTDSVTSGEFDGRKHSNYGRLCKNINFCDFYGTKKLYNNDSEYCLGLMKAAFEDFKIRNSMACPAFFDRLCKSTDYDSFWVDFMLGANKPSVFNPTVYKSILDNLFSGEVLFAPVSGWNAYQLAFYGSQFKHFVTTDVIPKVIDNGKWLQREYENHQAQCLVTEKKTSHHYLCPSEDLKNTDFLSLYRGNVDAVLFSPPYFDLEIYPSDHQSITNYSDYSQWLLAYWEETVTLCAECLRKGGRMGFVISNYTNKSKQKTTISEDMAAIAEKHLSLHSRHRVRWSAIAVSRQAMKTRGGNFEDLWIYEKTV